LTGNGGGLLDEAAMLADQFLEKDKLLVYTKGRKTRRQDFFSTSQGLFEKGKLVIMIDENSASASEILSGAIQDWDRGIIVGRRSFGKGLVQRPLMYPDGSMLKLTIAHYYTPSGRDIQRPYKNGNSDEYYNDFINRYKHNELSNKDSIHFVDSLKKLTLVLKRPVFGGGGIMPDIFVPIDTSMYSDYYRDLLRNGTLYKFVLNYIDTNRIALKKQYPDFQKFNASYCAEQLFPAMIDFASKDNIKFNQQQFEQSKNAISKLLKAYIARDIWDSSEFFQVFNSDDPIIKEALKAIDQYDTIISPPKK
ncbi:MAG TPA: S41 family peptidase, partial [Bacteroidales bacterium]